VNDYLTQLIFDKEAAGYVDELEPPRINRVEEALKAAFEAGARTFASRPLDENEVRAAANL
jgi:hypothetical protein